MPLPSARGSITFQDTVRLSDLAHRYLLFARSRGGAATTQVSYDITYTAFIEFLHAQGLTDDVRHFTPETVSDWIGALQGRGLKASSINVKLAALKSLGDFGVKTKDGRGKYILDENPLMRVYRPKRQPRRERYLTRDELRQLLAAPCSPDARLTLDVLVDTALRASELAGANVEHLRLDGDRLILSVRVKGGRYREVTLGKDVAAKLLEALKFREARPHDPLLVTDRGVRHTRSTLSALVATLALRAGITRVRAGAHIVRHSVASLASAAGAELPVIAALLNHSDLSTVHRYVHRNEAVDAAREAVRKALAGDDLGVMRSEPNASDQA